MHNSNRFKRPFTSPSSTNFEDDNFSDMTPFYNRSIQQQRTNTNFVVDPAAGFADYGSGDGIDQKQGSSILSPCYLRRDCLQEGPTPSKNVCIGDGDARADEMFSRISAINPNSSVMDDPLPADWNDDSVWPPDRKQRYLSMLEQEAREERVRQRVARMTSTSTSSASFSPTASSYLQQQHNRGQIKGGVEEGNKWQQQPMMMAKQMWDMPISNSSSLNPYAKYGIMPTDIINDDISNGNNLVYGDYSNYLPRYERSFPSTITSSVRFGGPKMAMVGSRGRGGRGQSHDWFAANYSINGTKFDNNSEMSANGSRGGSFSVKQKRVGAFNNPPLRGGGGFATNHPKKKKKQQQPDIINPESQQPEIVFRYPPEILESLREVRWPVLSKLVGKKVAEAKEACAKVDQILQIEQNLADLLKLIQNARVFNTHHRVRYELPPLFDKSRFGDWPRSVELRVEHLQPIHFAFYLRSALLCYAENLQFWRNLKPIGGNGGVVDEEKNQQRNNAIKYASYLVNQTAVQFNTLAYGPEFWGGDDDEDGTENDVEDWNHGLIGEEGGDEVLLLDGNENKGEFEGNKERCKVDDGNFIVSEGVNETGNFDYEDKEEIVSGKQIKPKRPRKKAKRSIIKLLFDKEKCNQMTLSYHYRMTFDPASNESLTLIFADSDDRSSVSLFIDHFLTMCDEFERQQKQKQLNFFYVIELRAALNAAYSAARHPSVGTLKALILKGVIDEDFQSIEPRFIPPVNYWDRHRPIDNSFEKDAMRLKQKLNKRKKDKQKQHHQQQQLSTADDDDVVVVDTASEEQIY